MGTKFFCDKCDVHKFENLLLSHFTSINFAFDLCKDCTAKLKAWLREET